MSAFAVAHTARSGVDAQLLLDRTPLAGTWSERNFSVAWNDGVHVCVEADRVVVLDGAVHGALPSGGSPAGHVLSAWRSQGPAALNRLTGDFAGVVYDRRTDRLTAFRDLVGGRPLFVAAVGGDRLVATRARDLLRWPGLPLTPSESWAAGYLVGTGAGAMARPELTPYVAVSRVLGGHTATPQETGWSQVRVAHFQLPERSRRSDAEYAVGLREVLDDALRFRTAGLPALAVALSGGLDSTALIASARATNPDIPLTALCVPFTDASGDERAMQRMMAAQVGAELVWVSTDGFTPVGTSPTETFDRFGAPPTPANWFLGDALAAAAAAAGLPAVMDGEDCDSLLSGNPGWLTDLLTHGRWLRWRAEVGAVHDTWRLSRRGLLRRAVTELLPSQVRRSWLRPTLPVGIGRGLAHRSGLRASLRSSSHWRPFTTYASTDASFRRPGLLADLAMNTTPWYAERDITVVRPFLDRRVIEYAGSLPWDQKYRGATHKFVLREAMRGRLPEELLARLTKANLSSAFNTIAAGPARRHVLEGLELASRGIDEWFDPVAVAGLRTAFETGGDPVCATRVALLAHWQEWLRSGGPARSHSLGDR